MDPYVPKMISSSVYRVLIYHHFVDNLKARSDAVLLRASHINKVRDCVRVMVSTKLLWDNIVECVCVVN